MAWLFEFKRSQILQILLCCSLFIYFLFWDLWIGTLCGQPSILVWQREGIVNFRVKWTCKKQWIEEEWFCDISSVTATIAASVTVIWDKKENSQLFTPHCEQTCKIKFNESQQSTRANNLFLPVRCTRVQCFTGRSQAIDLFGFFESSIMRKIGSRVGCRACCVSGSALSEGSFAYDTPLVYLVFEPVFSSGMYFKTGWPLYQDE
jgi:hypothetical protein